MNCYLQLFRSKVLHHNLLHSWMYGKMNGEKNNSIKLHEITDKVSVYFIYTELLKVKSTYLISKSH